MAKTKRLLALVLTAVMLAGMFTMVNVSATTTDAETETTDMYGIYTDAANLTRSLGMTWADWNTDAKRFDTHFFDRATNELGFMTGWVARPLADGTNKAGYFIYGGAQYTRGAQMKLDGVTGAVVLGWNMYSRNLVRAGMNVTINTTGESDWSTTNRADADGIYLLASDTTSFHLGHNSLSDAEKALYNAGSSTMDTQGTWKNYALVADVKNRKITLYEEGVSVLSGDMPEGVEAIYGLSMGIYNAKADGNWATAPTTAIDGVAEDNPEMVLADLSLYEISEHNLQNFYYTYTNADYQTRHLTMDWADHNAGKKSYTDFWDYLSGAANYNYVARGGTGCWTDWAGAAPGSYQMKLDGVKGAVVLGADVYAKDLGSADLEFKINTNSAADWSTSAAADADTVWLTMAGANVLYLGHNTMNPELYKTGGSTPLDTNGAWVRLELVADVANQKVILYMDGEKVLSGAMPEGVDAIYGLAMRMRNWIDSNPTKNPGSFEEADSVANGYPELLIRNYSLYEIPAKALLPVVPGLELSELKILNNGTAIDTLDGVAAGDSLTASVYVNFSADAEGFADCVLVLAAYNGNVLQGIKMAPVTLDPGVEGELLIEEPITVADTADLKVKAFVWDTMSLQTPLIADLEL